jgi:AraC family transcriptional regulator
MTIMDVARVKCSRGREELTLSPMQVRRIREYVRAHLACNLRLADLADQVNLSPHYFSMLFKHSLGISPHRYILHECIQEAQKRLAAGGMSISEVALSLGFSDQSHFSQTFRRMTGTTPKQYQSACWIPFLKPTAARRPLLHADQRGFC